MEVYNVLVRLLDGKTATLKFSSPVIAGESIKRSLYKITQIPPQYQRLVTGSRQINEETLITVPDIGGFSTVDLLLRLRGGKGGFGSLLRGAATKAGQKKTNNFDACRDMSGRRLRHVNAEKKLEEWKAEAEERKLEKVAEDFIKKKAKAVKKAGSGESEKYIAKYKEDSAKCMEDVEAAVRASFALHKDSKRKMLPTSGSSSKRFKLWSDKEDDDESDSDDEDDDRSVVLDDGTHALKTKDGEGSSGSASVEHSDGGVIGLAVKIKDVVGNMSSSPVSGGHSDGESSGGGSSNLEEENVIVNHGNTEEGKGSSYVESHDEGVCNLVAKSSSCEQMASETRIDPKVGLAETESEICKETCHSANVLSLGSVEDSENGQTVVEDTVLIPKKPLNFDDINSAVELEGLGMEQLKSELQARGLKCGGTLRERAARLFLLKTTPLEMLPKKLLAKK